MLTFGKTSNGDSSSGTSTETKKVSQATPIKDGVLTNLRARIWRGAGTANAKAVVYSDNAGQPDALLATSDEVSISNTSESEVNFPFSGGNQINLTAGTPYWIGIIYGGGAAVNFSNDSTANGNKYNNDTYSDGPTDPFGTPSNSSGIIDAYGIYTVDGDILYLRNASASDPATARQLTPASGSGNNT